MPSAALYGFVELIIFRGQRGAQEAANLRIVFDHQDQGLHGCIQRKANAKDGAAAFAMQRFDGAAVRHDDSAADGESQAGSAHAFRFSAIEFFEQALFFAVRESRAAVAHFQLDSRRSVASAAISMGLSRRAVFGGILEQIHQHLTQ